MSDLVVFITGVGRGIGNALARAYLLKPKCTVIGSVRDDTTPSVSELQSSPQGSNSQLLIVHLESSNPSHALDAVKTITETGIKHIDILICNSGISPRPMDPISSVPISTMNETFQVNALGPLAIYQACRSLLEKSANAKFITITSAAGSIGGMERFKSHVAPAYCVSKAALNWITLATHCNDPWLTAVAVNPGLVATDMGNRAAEYMGLEKAPWTADQSAEKIMVLIDKATRDTYSGKFMDAIGDKELPW